MPRKRQVFQTYEDLIKVWVARSQPTGRTPLARIHGRDWNHNSSRLTFEGDTLYSYGHFPIARRISDTVAFVTTRYWSTTVKKSPTTEGHKRLAHWALDRAGIRVFELDDIDADRASQLESFFLEFREGIQKCQRSRYPGYFRMRLRETYAALCEIERFAKTFDLPYDRRWAVQHLAPLVKSKVRYFRQIVVDRTKRRLGVQT